MREQGPYYLGIDIGTGSVKVMLIDERGVSKGSAACEYKTYYPFPGHVEQAPEDWYRGTVEAVRRLIAESGMNPAGVAGIGICGTAHASILLDDRHRVLRPTILWSDQRSEREVKSLESLAGTVIRDLTLNSVNCTWTLPQLLWVRGNEPQVYEKIRYVLVSKDYIVYRLTGRMISDTTCAFSSLLVDAATRDWDPFLIKTAGLRREVLPEILSPTDVAGFLTPEAARDLGLTLKVRVAAGFIDSASEMVGVGALDETIGVIRLGSAGGVMAVKKEGRYRKGCLAYPHPIAPSWFYQAGTNSCTTSLLWARNLFAKSGRNLSHAGVDLISRQAPPACDGLFFHPYLLGERAPYWNPNLKGGFNGIKPTHERAHFFRAVQEGVAFSLLDCLAEIDWESVDEARMCGGGAKSLFWSAIISDVFGIPVVLTRHIDASPFGAALLATAAESGGRLSEIVLSHVRRKNLIEPDRERHDIYRKAYERYREVSKHLVDIYRPEDTP